MNTSCGKGNNFFSKLSQKPTSYSSFCDDATSSSITKLLQFLIRRMIFIVCHSILFSSEIVMLTFLGLKSASVFLFQELVWN